MFKRAAVLGLLAPLAACSVNTSEPLGSSSAAITTSLANLQVSATGTTMAFSWSGSAAYTIALSGPGVSSTLAATHIGSSESATFSGLPPCASLAWTISAGGVPVQSGVSNTRSASGGACGLIDVVIADTLWRFEGVEHQEQQNIGCGNWTYASWPIGYGWNAIPYSGGAYSSAEWGAFHFSNNSSFCAESTIQAYRTQLEYHLSAAQWARGVTNATLNATVTSTGNACAANGTAAANVMGLRLATFGQNTQGPAWAGIMGAPETDLGLLAQQPADALTPITTSGNHLSVNYGVPAYSTVLAGFEGNDGFADLTNGATQTWAADDNTCVSTITNAALDVIYAGPLPPETPLNCIGAVACGGSTTVTCSASPDVFQLHAIDSWNGNRVVATSDVTNGGTPTMTYPIGSSAESYQVCTINAVGASSCTPVTIASVTACPAVPYSITLGAGVLWTSETANVVVTLNETAPAGGTPVALSTLDPWSEGRATGVTLPATVTVPAGQASISVPVTVAATALPAVEILATANGSSASAGFQINTGNVYMTFSSGDTDILAVGSSGSLSIWVRYPAPAGGAAITLTQSLPGTISVPSNVALQPGAATATVDVTGLAWSRTIDNVTATYEGSAAVQGISTGPALKTPPVKCKGLCQ